MMIPMRDAVKAFLAIEQCSTDRLPFETALNLRKTRAELREAVNLYSERERALIQRCAALDGEGNPVTAGAGRFKLRPECLESWKAEKTELDEASVEVTRRRLSSLGSVSLEQLDALEKIFDLPETPEEKED